MKILVFDDLALQQFATRLKASRKAIGLTQAQLAWRCDFHLPTLINLENGKGKGLRALTLVRLAKALDVSLDYLCALTNDPRPRPPLP